MSCKVKFKKRRRLLRPIPTDNTEIEKIAEDLLTWVRKNSTEHALTNFSDQTKICNDDLKLMAECNDYFSRCLKLAKDLIALRIQYGWRDGKLDRLYASNMMERYDEEYHLLIKAKKSAHLESKQEAQRIDVVEIPTWNTGPTTSKSKKKAAEA